MNTRKKVLISLTPIAIIVIIMLCAFIVGKHTEDEKVMAMIQNDFGEDYYISHASRNGYIDYLSRSTFGPMMNYHYIVHWGDHMMSIYYIEKDGAWVRSDYKYSE